MRRTPIAVKQTNKQRKKAQYMKQKKQWRQGDVLVESVKALPEGFQHQRGRVILADGEATGHVHEIDEEEGELWKMREEIAVRVVRDSATLHHQEHGPIKIVPGSYVVTRQREYTPGEIRRVAD
jgi:hypothetical protein